MAHVLRFDPNHSTRANTFFARQLPSGSWSLHLYVKFAESNLFHAVVYAHQPYADGRRRRDPEGNTCLLLARVSEDVFRIESTQIHPNAPRTSFDLLDWCAPKDAA